MPNWCSNGLYVTGETLEVKDFFNNNFVENPEEFGEEMVLSFGKALPEPKFEDPKEQEAYDSEGWYHWRNANWGVKWEPNTIGYDFNEDYAEGETCLQIDFDTPWGPPIEWVDKLIELYPTLDFELVYEEPGQCFQGKYQSENGSVIVDDCWDWVEELDEEFIEDLKNEQEVDNLKEGN